MKVVCLSDTHGMHTEINKVKWNGHYSFPLEPGDCLVHAGDTTAYGKYVETLSFINWLGSQDYKYKICIAGNHDETYATNHYEVKEYMAAAGIHYLKNESCVIEGVKFWGSPFTPTFFDWWFMQDDELLGEKWRTIPGDTDVLITHGPPYGKRDATIQERTGSHSLMEAIKKRPSIKYHVFGHIHEGFGVEEEDGVTYINASFLNSSYTPHGRPQPTFEICASNAKEVPSSGATP